MDSNESENDAYSVQFENVKQEHTGYTHKRKVDKAGKVVRAT